MVIDVPNEPVTVKCRTSVGTNEPAAPPRDLAIGIDVVDLDEIEAALEQFGERYLQRVFSPKETAGRDGGPRAGSRRLAECFASKEATRKALGVGDEGVAWPSIALVEDAAGALDLELSGRAAALAAERGITGFAVSVTHVGRLVLALVLASTEPQREEAS